MAHFARINEGIVVDVHVVANAALDSDAMEESGQMFLAGLWGGEPSDYVQASYNNIEFRGGYPGIGWSWNGSAFVPPVVEVPDTPLEPEVEPTGSST